MRKIILIVLSLVSTFVFSDPEIKGSPEDIRGFLYPSDKIVTIAGEAEQKAYSDTAIVSLVITTEDKLLSLSISKNADLRKEITDSLSSNGISRDAIKSSKFSSSPQYGWFGSKPSSYKVVNRMAISITDELHLQDIAAVADRMSEAELSDTAFEHSKKEEFNKNVKAQALEKVMNQKAFYEQSLGVTLVPVGIRDSNIHQQATRGAAALEELIVTSVRQESSRLSSSAKYQKPGRQSSFDEVKHQANIAVDFKIQ